MVKLGILDYAQIDEGSSSKEALNNTIKLAQYCESLGYERFWVAEHHNVPAFASSSPELLMMKLLAHTEKIRIGSGGVMLPHYAPLKVAENFRILEAYYPHRVDLGMGNSRGTSQVYAALNEDKSFKQNYEQKIVDIQAFLTDSLDQDHAQHGIAANPVIEHRPQMWLLSSSVKSARIAARLGLGYCFGVFPYASKDRLQVGIEACQVYRDEFKPSTFMTEPIVSVAPFLAVAETEDEGLAFAEALDLWLLGLDNFSELKQFPSIETARHFNYSDTDRQAITRNRIRSVVGGIESVTAQLKSYVNQLQADELLLVPLMPGFNNRKKAIELLAEAFK
ncbi:LLM class flavin-dependent oxidoreductase [Facklamia lactis]|uniref:LLM class flavin-dependent oxidoreductase n=1 Tax=Facklamia lactis TaxID=2749967 RepID=UPI0018CE3DFC|nr:LLM class flavin-dependent oxidoreductase [Facklamia lactis]MBG9980293.1 LLM class flavin-dependent oxidoreductase [Facklamia lactis]